MNTLKMLLGMVCFVAACGGNDLGQNSCGMSEPPPGVVLVGGVNVTPERCGAHTSPCKPVCWICTNGPSGEAKWDVTGNDACRVDGGTTGADAGAADAAN